MIKPVHLSTLFSLLVVSLCLVVAGQQPQQAVDANVGRENPFATLAEKNPAASQQNQEEPVVVEQKPDLFVETVTLKFLDAENLKKVLDSMLSDYGTMAANPKSNSLIICDTRDNLARILGEIKKADKTQQQIMFVETVTLKFLKAKNLKNALDKMSSKRGSIAIDDNTNSLIICDTKDSLEKILAEIKKADKTPEQIMIEVVILDVQLENDTEIGVNWDRLFDPARDESYSQLLVTTLSTTGVTGADFSLIKTSISGTIHALQETRDIEILASPRALVVSGEQAQIQTVEEIPYRELIDTAAGGEAALTSTEFREVGVTLKVKATVTDERKILLVIESEQSVNTGEEGIQDVPIIDKRLAKTTLLMDDGQIVAMGGLRRKETKFIVNKIPILGDLPLVGMFFSNDQKIANEYELLILISPHIYKGEPIDDEQMKKFNELRERPMLSLPGDSKIFLRIPTNAEQKKQSSKQKYPTSAE